MELHLHCLCRKAFAHLFDKLDQGLLKEGKKPSKTILEIHKKRYTDLLISHVKHPRSILF